MLRVSYVAEVVDQVEIEGERYITADIEGDLSYLLNCKTKHCFPVTIS